MAFTGQLSIKIDSIGLIGMQAKKHPKTKQQAGLGQNSYKVEISLMQISRHWEKIAARLSATKK